MDWTRSKTLDDVQQGPLELTLMLTMQMAP
jgi:hypothetical protein